MTSLNESVNIEAIVSPEPLGMFKFHPMPKSLSEASKVSVYGMNPKDKNLSEKEVMKAHLKQNSILYNTMFYNDDYAQQLSKLPGNEFLDHFYPSFKIHTFISRTMSSIGGIYKNENPGNISIYTVNMKDYDPKVNWYKVAYKDEDHLTYCVWLYDIVRDMMNASTFPDVNEGQVAKIIDDWEIRVRMHYQKMTDTRQYSPEYFKEAQALHDLMWDPLDNPDDPNVKASNIISFVRILPDRDTSRPLIPLSEAVSGEMISKEDVQAWMKKELDPKVLKDYYLLPEKKQFLIIDKDSIKYAMDAIPKVPVELRKEYATNLNRLWWKFQPEIKIGVDHPYAKYLSIGGEGVAIPPEMIVVPILTGRIDKPVKDIEDDKGWLPESYSLVESVYSSGSMLEETEEEEKELPSGGEDD